MNEEALFARLIGMPLDQRAALSEEQCGRSELRERVEKLLQAHQSDQSLLDLAAGHSLGTTSASPLAEKHPVIGNYKLLQKLGEGGFGVVFMADQLRPVRRKVALKIVKAERLADSHGTLARFEAERQALVTMDHPQYRNGVRRCLDPPEKSDVASLATLMQLRYNLAATSIYV